MSKAKDQEQKSTEVAVVQQGAIAVPDFMSEDDFDSGFEGADKDSYAIPFLQILQKMSPMVDEDNAAYVEGAKAGMIYNTVTKKLYDGKKGILLIPCSFKRSFIQWGGRDVGGGFKGEFTPEQILTLQADGQAVPVEGKLFKPNEDGSPINDKKNDYYADTRSHFVIVLDEETGESSPAILSLSSTNIKASRNLLTSLSQKKVTLANNVKKTPPTFANIVRMTTMGASNEKGAWSAASFALEGMVTDANVYNDAKNFYKSVNDGSVKADHAKSGGDVTGNAAGADGPQTTEEF